MVKKKRLTKRLTLKDKYKVERKRAEHRRKERKQAALDERTGAARRRALRKDPGVPNLWPFKEQLLRQIEEKKAREEERKARRVEELKRARWGPSEEDLLEAARASSAAMGGDGDEEMDVDSGSGSESEEEDGDLLPDARAGFEQTERRKRHAGSKLRAVVEEADVILEILDARGPAGARAKEGVGMAVGRKKRVVLVLNKTDLVPERAVRGWMRALRREYPTLPFRATTQKQRANFKKAAGADELVRLLKNYARDAIGGKASLVVGIVGAPNVGKSSIVNSLKLARAVNASAQAGSTKKSQHVQIDASLTLIDTPGVVTDAFQRSPDPAVEALRVCLNPVGPSQDDPVSCVERLAGSLPRERLMMEYGLARFESPREFLVALATKSGKLGKGGVVRVEEAARRVIADCASGKFRLFVEPPQLESSSSASSGAAPGAGGADGDAAVLEELGDEFEFDEDETAIPILARVTAAGAR